ncbi:MAG: amino-acid N-acetyltransferase [Oceanicoccus sp.]|uniref:amino-acid N-acetyltransferase n=1 Tax=Oceanicoccus sp. TaxID=2691044 RepID=UPI00261004E3|nr:amino-acid N-acetyltransferase [Oceanicoccus sp.]MCP3908986.1 amino-acid N-acetyltransferase [Oceanicoccus sp.]MDG1772142.1 amino-acid N-acetyltransferase [Oceanicoccus sp.]
MPTKDYVKWFRNSAPYINAHRGKTFVLMFSGDAVAHPNFANIIHDIALLNSLGVKLILAHGARPQIEERVALRGISSRIENDIRITDGPTLECVKDAAGSVRAQIEALLTMGLANSPMHGAQIRVCSGNFVVAKPIGIRNGVDYEHTGMVRRVDTQGIAKQLDDGSIVLLSPTGYSPTGEVFNLSLEDVATQSAIAMQADKLIVFSAQDGLLDTSGDLIQNCSVSEIKYLLDHSDDPETASLLRAIATSGENGISRCHCVSYSDDGALLQELFTRDGAGTLISQDHYEQLRTATIEDVGGILELIEPLEAEGSLVKRSRELLENEINLFTVIERDGMIVACAGLYPYEESASGEIACVATHPDYRGEDRGERLLAALEMQAREKQLASVFVLTTQTAHWFQELGFVEITQQQLPEKKKQLYNLQRNSKVFSKNI